MKILMGVDGSSCSENSIADLINAGLPYHAEAVVLSAADVLLPVGKRGNVPPYLQGIIRRSHAAARLQVRTSQETARKAGKKLKKIFPGWKIKIEGLAGSPAWSLVSKAEQWKPDLVVVGAHGHSAWGRYLGSVSNMVLAQSPASVRVGRGRTNTKRSYLRILIGIDGSEGSQAALREAANRMWPLDTEFLLMSAIDTNKSSMMSLTSTWDWYMEWVSNERDAMGRLLESLANQLRAKGARVTCEVRTGNPSRLLVDRAASWQADCVFVGARGLSLFKRMVTGGVSIAVASRAPCSVEVIRDRKKKA